MNQKVLILSIFGMIALLVVLVIAFMYYNGSLSITNNTNNRSNSQNLTAISNATNNQSNANTTNGKDNGEIKVLSPSQVNVNLNEIVYNPFENYSDHDLLSIYEKAKSEGPERPCKVLPKYQWNSCIDNYYIYRAYEEDNIYYCNNIKYKNKSDYDICRYKIVLRKVAIENFLEASNNKSYNGTPHNIYLCNNLTEPYRSSCKNMSYVTALFDEPDEIVPSENISSLGKLFLSNLNSLTPVYYVNDTNQS